MRIVPYSLLALILCLMSSPVALASALDAVMEYRAERQARADQEAQNIPNAVMAFRQGRQQAEANRIEMLSAQAQLAMAEQEYARQQAYMESELERQRAEAVAEEERRVQAVQRILLPIFNTHKELLDDIAFGLEGLRKNKTHFLGSFLLWTEISQESLQTPSKFRQGADAIEEFWVDNSLTADMKKYYLRAFKGFAQAAESQIKAYQHGAMFWLANPAFEKATAENDLAFQDAIKAVEKKREFLLATGTDEDNDSIKALDHNLEELKRVHSDFKNG
jgi:hypothetical protein